MTEFDRCLIRLKECLGVKEDQEVAKLLGMSKAAFSDRKRRGAFPTEKMLSLKVNRPDLPIDDVYVLTGDYRSVYEAKAILARNRIEEEAGVAYSAEPAIDDDETELLVNYRTATEDGKAAIKATARAVQKIKTKENKDG